MLPLTLGALSIVNIVDKDVHDEQMILVSILKCDV